VILAATGSAALVCLVGCSSPKPAAFRNAGAPIWSAAAFEPGRVAGTWQQVAAFAAGPGGCAAGGLEIAAVPEGLAVKGGLCLDGQVQRIDTVARTGGPGRLAVPGQEDWWVLWVDTDYRTLAVGTPSGRFGFVLDRGTLPGDRLTAAREVFDFNGYSTGALRPF
jgi:apolipoprotein D and lipocalin family protein